MNDKVAYIDAHRAEYGVESICRALEDTPAQIAPSSYYAARSRRCWVRSLRDAELSEQITRIHVANYGVYGGAGALTWTMVAHGGSTEAW